METRDRDRGWQRFRWPLRNESPARLWPSALVNIASTVLAALVILAALRMGIGQADRLAEQEKRGQEVTAAHRAATLGGTQ